MDKVVRLIQPVVNRRRITDSPFNAYMGKRGIGLYAVSLGAAKQYAIEHFKPKKNERHHIVVKLAEA